MTLKEIVKIMNMAQLDVCSKTIKALWGRKDIDMFDLENDPIVKEYGGRRDRGNQEGHHHGPQVHPGRARPLPEG